MIDPMKDWMLSVVPVNQSVSTTPAITAGTVDTTIIDNFTDWKLAASSRKITTTASKSPVRRPSNICCIGTTCPRTATLTLGGGVPSFLMAFITWFATLPRSAPPRLAVTVIIRCML